MQKPPKTDPGAGYFMIAICFVFLGGIGYYVNSVAQQRRQENLQARGTENFNEAQRELWTTCSGISQALGAAFEKSSTFSGFNQADWQMGRRLMMPHECLFLEDLAAKTYRARVQGKGN